jgi:hypoxanthine phosphoribosyltransferase
MAEHVRRLFSATEIERRVRELGQQITRDYAGRRLVLLCVLKGGFVFAADLARQIDLPLRIEFLGLQSYGAGTASSGVVQITQDLTAPVDGSVVRKCRLKGLWGTARGSSARRVACARLPQ